MRLKATLYTPCPQGSRCPHGKTCQECKGTGKDATRKWHVSSVADGDCYYCTGTGIATCRYCGGTGRRAHYEGMYLCVGGPNHGEFLNRSALPSAAYCGFNAASRGDGESQIWVHKSLLP